jgi:hypothetical protein
MKESFLYLIDLTPLVALFLWFARDASQLRDKMCLS